MPIGLLCFLQAYGYDDSSQLVLLANMLISRNILCWKFEDYLLYTWPQNVIYFHLDSSAGCLCEEYAINLSCYLWIKNPFGSLSSAQYTGCNDNVDICCSRGLLLSHIRRCIAPVIENITQSQCLVFTSRKHFFLLDFYLCVSSFSLEIRKRQKKTNTMSKNS